MAAHEERLGDRRSRSLGDAQRLALPAQVLAQDHELVAAVADHGVAGPERALQSAGDLDEQIVAGVVAEPVVDAFEAVEVEEQQRERGGMAARASDRDVEPVEQEHAVRQAGKRIVERLVREAGRGALALDRVADRPVERIGVGGRLDQVVLGAVVDRAQGGVCSSVSASTTTGTSGRSTGLRRGCRRVVVAGRKVEHDAVDVCSRSARRTRGTVSRQHVGMAAGASRSSALQRRGSVRVTSTTSSRSRSLKSFSPGGPNPTRSCLLPWSVWHRG